MSARSWRITAPAPTHASVSYRRVHDDNGAGPSRPRPASKRRARDSSRESRRLSPTLHDGVYGSYGGLMREIEKNGFDEDRLSSLDRHVILHHIIRRSKRGGPLAIQAAAEFMKGDATIRDRTMSVICYKKNHTVRKVKKVPIQAISSTQQPSIEDQQPLQIPPRSAEVLVLSETMQRRHLTRPKTLYDLVIRQAVAEDRPDIAAKAFVGLVEDWIIEGRIAEGADPEDFYRGGGPPRHKPKSTPLHQLWFSGVRTWRWPGEALSPHDRLDLWHPQHHASDERSRGFPMPVPTSPPSLVPHPTSDLSELILESLDMDPTTVHPRQYAATMRALAILANTILSRTLPINNIPPLLAMFSKANMYPSVYPESFTEEPRSNAWAYTANTQVHVALVSLMLSPPNYSQAAEMTEKSSRRAQEKKKEEGPAQYMLGPSSWRSCLVLIKYAAAQSKQPSMVTRVVAYMRSTFRDWSPTASNVFFRSSNRSGQYGYAQNADDALFGGTTIGRRGSSKDDLAAMPNMDSVIALIKHSQSTEQIDRLVKLTYASHPFSQSVRGENGDSRPEVHPSPEYVALVEASGSVGKVNLAQRVFGSASHAESSLVGQFRRENPGTREPQEVYLPSPIFTAMIRMFGAEAGRGRGENKQRRGWFVPAEDVHLSRTAAAESMILRIHKRVMTRYRAGAGQEGRIVPDERYSNAVIRGMRFRWHLEAEDAARPSPAQAKADLEKFLGNVAELGLTTPPGSVSKFKTGTIEGPTVFETTAPFGPAAPLPTSPELVKMALAAVEEERQAMLEDEFEELVTVPDTSERRRALQH